MLWLLIASRLLAGVESGSALPWHQRIAVEPMGVKGILCKRCRKLWPTWGAWLGSRFPWNYLGSDRPVGSGERGNDPSDLNVHPAGILAPALRPLAVVDPTSPSGRRVIADDES